MVIKKIDAYKSNAGELFETLEEALLHGKIEAFIKKEFAVELNLYKKRELIKKREDFKRR